MSQELTIIENDDDCGPCMTQLTGMRRRFVYAMLQLGGSNQTQAAIMAGFSPATASAQGSNLMRDSRVLAALREEGDKRLRSGVILGASVLMEIAQDVLHKDRYKAACRLLDQSGLIIKTEHTVNVQHSVSEKDQIAKITAMAKQLGMDPQLLLGQAGHIVDAEFTIITPPAAVPEDEWTVQPKEA